jgi:hypothetical protein
MSEPVQADLAFSFLGIINLSANGALAIIAASVILVAVGIRIVSWRPLVSVLYSFYYLWMERQWTEQDSLRLSIVIGLRKGLSLCRGMRKTLTEEQQKTVADEIIKHLELSNWKIAQGPPLEDGARHIAGGSGKSAASK